MKTLSELFDKITKELKKGKQLASLGPILQSYDGNDWKEFEIYHADHYSRNLAMKNDILEIVVLCWKSGQGCLPHDHPENGCLLTIVKGKLKENTYTYNGSKQFTQKTILYKGMIGYKEGKNMLHSVFNHTNLRAVSIHLYSPPEYQPVFY